MCDLLPGVLGTAITNPERSHRMLIRFTTALALLAGAHAYPHGASSNHGSTLPLSLQMANSIMSRHQGILASMSDRSSLLQAGFVQKTFRQLAEQYPDQPEINLYTRASVDSVITTISNATLDTTFPLDRLSSGNGLFHAFQETRNATYKAAYEALLTSVHLQPRNNDGSLWYYVYPNYTYLDGMYSLTPFITLYATSSNITNTPAIDFVIRQLTLTYRHTLQPSNLLVHGYDASLRAPWAVQTTGASSIVWGRSLGWYCMALIDTLELLPQSAIKARVQLKRYFSAVMHAVVQAVDAKTGVWYQVVDQPGREGNYVESSASSMFVYALMKGVRMGFLDEEMYVGVAKRAYGYIKDTFVVQDGNGTLRWDGTVGVCSLNSSATYQVSYGLIGVKRNCANCCVVLCYAALSSRKRVGRSGGRVGELRS